MDKKLLDVLNSREENYVFPFYWQHGNHTERIPEQVRRIRSSGARALCVESRPHGDFCGETWWRDMDLIIGTCEEEGMEVWLLDDSHFPTGFSNGAVISNPDKRKLHLMETHVDFIGPMKNATCIVRYVGEFPRLVGAYMYKRSDSGKLTEEFIDVSDKIKDEVLTVDVGAGYWRVFFLFAAYGADLFPNYIDMINPESVDLLIDTVYETHYEHYKDKFGKTFRGFFSDEPAFANGRFNTAMPDRGIYDYTLGMNGLALPWSNELKEMLDSSLGKNSIPYLPLLWFEGETMTEETRFAYMDVVTFLYNKHFTRRLARWCHVHGVDYIGHVVEDMNVSSRFGYGSGHYFRALTGQDMSGYDIVLHQVMPGYATMPNVGSCYEGEMETEFFHYVLGKLGSSLSHFEPNMKNRTMCELFGAYGWAEGTRTMKWLADFALVRGSNRFVQHAFSPTFPDYDCPPHFGAEGNDPQYEGFGKVIDYLNKAAHLFEDSVHQCDVLVMYDAVGEWTNGDSNIMRTQVCARALWDKHIDFDIVSCDYLAKMKIVDGEILLNEEKYKSLVIPFSPKYPKKHCDTMKKLISLGAKIVFVDGAPEGEDFDVIKLCDLAEEMKKLGTHVSIDGCPLLRHYLVRRGDTTVLMLFNESMTETAETTVKLEAFGDFVELDILGDTMKKGKCDGSLNVSLKPYQSAIYIIGDVSDVPATPEYREISSEKYEGNYKISTSKYNDMDSFTYMKDSASPEISAELGRFAGKIKYEFELDAKKDEKTIVEFDSLGENGKLLCNGVDCGLRVCPPYRFDITKALKDGKNELELICSTTLAFAFPDNFSRYMQIAPLGISGDVTVKKYEEVK